MNEKPEIKYNGKPRYRYNWDNLTWDLLVTWNFETRITYLANNGYKLINDKAESHPSASFHLSS